MGIQIKISSVLFILCGLGIAFGSLLFTTNIRGLFGSMCGFIMYGIGLILAYQATTLGRLENIEKQMEEARRKAQ